MEPNTEKVVKIPNNLDSLSLVRQEVKTFLIDDFPLDAVGKVIFCIDEIVTNIIEHGFPNKTNSLIQVRMIKTSKDLKFIITDSGIPFDPTKKKSDTWKHLYESGSDGGFGLRSVKKIMTVEYKRLVAESLNELTLSYTRINR
ncbi:ATP-binding protein [Leptospira vanthielii]|uniref:Histidine kinase-like ATPase domain protein n=1 Tax=Leptospira vanthielii serovar Holland str. Waz Holland = ATCC 700522 TaxID=1218591 RepID=N1W996_9LEPT|nr:ATP-binding protein [Leptospira vanthielii]EMY71553.1 histidine kinase-like ATPase domain protein [Leptospira vanthielii serovar Holland str. Waz Holland = ATCC 700522]